MKILMSTFSNNPNQQTSFRSKLFLEKSGYTQKVVDNLPETVSNGIELARKILSRNRRDEEVRMFCANDVCGYADYPNYWGLETKTRNSAYFSYPPTEIGGNFDFYKGKASRQVAKAILKAHNELASFNPAPEVQPIIIEKSVMPQVKSNWTKLKNLFGF